METVGDFEDMLALLEKHGVRHLIIWEWIRIASTSSGEFPA